MRTLVGFAPVSPGCLEPPQPGALDVTALRCAFEEQPNAPDYGPFVACCFREKPFGCPNGTPQACFATPEEAAAFCGAESCQLCVVPN